MVDMCCLLYVACCRLLCVVVELCLLFGSLALFVCVMIGVICCWLLLLVVAVMRLVDAVCCWLLPLFVVCCCVWCVVA